MAVPTASASPPNSIFPSGVALDGAGNLYVADQGNNTIRQVVLASGAVSTLAGTPTQSGSSKDGIGPAARFNIPAGVAADRMGNVYVADRFNNTIRQVVVATRAVTTLAGTAGQAGSADGIGPAARFNSVFAVAADDTGNLYVADAGNHTLRQVVVATGAVTTLAGTAGVPGNTDGIGSAARFYNSVGVAVDGAGNLNGDYKSAYIG